MSNSPRSGILIESGRFTCVAAPFWTFPAFAIPVVKSSGRSNVAYVQTVNERGRISGFELFDSVASLQQLDTHVQADIGDEEVFAIVDPYEVAFAGTRDQIRPIINRWLTSVDHPLTRMNFARFCGRKKIAQDAARIVVKEKKDEFGSEVSAIRWFVSSVIVLEIYRILALRVAADGGGSYEEILANADCRVNISKSGRIRIEISREMLDRSKRVINRKSRELANLLELTSFATGRDLDIVREGESGTAKENRGDHARKLDELTILIGSYGRQEQRLGALLDAILSGHDVAFEILRNYDDRASFARSAIQHLRGIINPKMHRLEVESRIAKSIYEISRMAYPQQRGQLLFDLAKSIGHVPVVSEAIRSIVNRSNHSDVIRVKRMILETLNRRSLF